MSSQTETDLNKTHSDLTVAANVPTLAIDGKTYEVDKLSDAARQQVDNIRTAEMEIGRLQMQQALMQTARNAYVQVLVAELNKASELVKVSGN